MQEAALDFGPGFTAVTGETGAGKSVLLGALSLLAGNRADKSVIRQGATECTVEAQFHFKVCQRIDDLLQAQGLPACDDGVLTLRRILHLEKPGRVTINGALTTLAALQTLGHTWIDFHGPGEPQKLFEEKNQLALLDDFAGNQAVMERYSNHWRTWRKLLGQAEALRTAERLSPDEAEFLRAQVHAIDAVSPSEESIAALERDFKRLSHAQEMAELASTLHTGLAGDEGLAGQAAPLMRAAHELAGIDPTAEPLSRRLEALIIEIDDLAGEFADLSGADGLDEESAAAIQERMQAWLSIKRRHGPTVEDVLAKHQSLSERLDSQGNIEERLEALQQQADAALAQLRSEATNLRRERMRAAKTLATRAAKLLTRLGFKKADFSIEITDEPEPTPHGDSSCRFLFSPNTGQKPLPLSKIASSGESARVMLALKAILAEADATPLLVFDEVDANVGGEIGAEVGRELATLAGNHQVLCVTHLPQVATCAHQHLLVEKTQSGQSTEVTIREIHSDTTLRTTEIARMLGDRKSASARHHARELLALPADK